MKLGFLGGTFNPPHLGHVRAAEAAVNTLGLDVLYVIPAGIPPHKELPANSADPDQRLEMACLAFGEIPGVLALERAKRHGIEAMCISPKKYADREQFHEALIGELKAAGVRGRA